LIKKMFLKPRRQNAARHPVPLADLSPPPASA
jgi:hypothetical protein